MRGYLEMDDELDNFIRERKARVAEDKANLEQDPPYMEIQRKPYRTYVSTVKENIPPNKSQGKEDSCSVGLPLGVEYEKKKQRLQHELRMDYRRYMAQHPSESQATFIPKQRPPSRRDAATLTEDSRGLYRTLREAKTCSPEDEEDRLSLSSRHHDRLGRPVDQESEEDEELELMDRRTHRHIGAERRTYKTDGRGKRDNTRGAAREGRRNRALTKNEDVEFATGLIIGTANTEEALKKRKERYRQELQEQIAEQHRNKKRERDLELKVAATGANDPEKPPDRIRQFGLSRRKDPQVLEPTATAESDSPPRAVPIIEKNGIREKVTPPPPPEHPRVAFQSPLLDYSAALGLGGGGVFPTHQPIAASFPRAMDTPRLPLFHPHPPSTLSEAYRSPYGEPPHHYYSRNHLDPHTSYYGHLAVPGVGLPMSYWNSPPGGGLSSQFGHHSPHSQHSGSSYPEPPIQSSNETATADPGPGLFPPERSRSARERILSYREALKQQEASRRESSELYNKIQEQQERRRLEREEKERYEAQLEADMKNHQPWGRGGGGAPLRDSTGKLIADLNQMHKQNEEAYSNPEQWQRRATAAMTAQRPEQPDPNERVSGTVAECSVHDSIDRLAGFTHVQTPQFARGNVFASQPTQQQLQEQDKYKAYLKQQIEEKLCKKAEERERTRLEEEKEEKRLAEQRARIQKEYEEEQEKKKRKELEQKAKNEELIQLAEQRKIEAERKKREADERENAALRKQYEKERQARLEEAHREPSPPIPTLQKKQGIPRYTPRPPTVESQHSTAPLSERSLSGLQSPPVPACRNQLRASGDHRDVFSELSALRRQLRSEQKRLEGRLQQGDWEDLESPLSDRHRERPQVDVFDMARLRLQAPVRRPNSRTTEPRNLLQIHDSLQLKYSDLDYRVGSSEVPKLDDVGVSTWRRRDYRDPYQPMNSQRSTVQDDYFDLSPPQQSDYLRSLMRGSARGSLLESESAFIDPLADALPIPHTPELEKKPQLSARERRRLAKQRPQHQPTGQPDDGLPQAGSSRQEDEDHNEERSTRDRTGRLLAVNRGGNTGPVDVSDDDSSPPQFSLNSPNQQSSVETVTTDQWMRPGTSDTLKCLDRPTRRGRLMT
ncbi:centrosome and spindle pole associated protein 1-like isoform X2 [Sphaeramia orbicularis]|uniref:centrosome and spindle pole associated protein 1-like isoform X2 n=1 Tax=Sphaeramia orbicularis TaxID=375764 RepID=UPI00117DE519|nr:centrosome and spindle pole associated protein 1-like isoform X2 [Sphaeramia orbicularis]